MEKWENPSMEVIDITEDIILGSCSNDGIIFPDLPSPG